MKRALIKDYTAWKEAKTYENEHPRTSANAPSELVAVMCIMPNIRHEFITSENALNACGIEYKFF